jgi:glycosyltransferase involved in cell wall biosynthesis
MPLRDESRRILGLPRDRPILAVIGCITPEKGYIELYQAARTLPKTFRMLLIGDTPGWVIPDPRVVAREAGWYDDTIFRLQFIPERLMPFVFSAIDAVALLYRETNGSSGILSCCRQYGRPVLASRFGELGEAVRRDGLGITVDPLDAGEVGAGITKLLSLGAPSVSRPSMCFTWADSAREHLDMYSRLSRGNHILG